MSHLDITKLEVRNKNFVDYLNGISELKIKHKYYDMTVRHAEDMGVHMEGEKPERLLNIQRPNETPEQKQYRLDIHEPVTMGLSEKVVNTVNNLLT